MKGPAFLDPQQPTVGPSKYTNTHMHTHTYTHSTYMHTLTRTHRDYKHTHTQTCKHRPHTHTHTRTRRDVYHETCSLHYRRTTWTFNVTLNASDSGKTLECRDMAGGMEVDAVVNIVIRECMLTTIV